MGRLAMAGARISMICLGRVGRFVVWQGAVEGVSG